MLAASVMWGLMAPVSKAAMNSDAVSAMLVADVRIFGAAILFWILSLFTKGEKVQEKQYKVKRNYIRRISQPVSVNNRKDKYYSTDGKIQKKHNSQASGTLFLDPKLLVQDVSGKAGRQVEKRNINKRHRQKIVLAQLHNSQTG